MSSDVAFNRSMDFSYGVPTEVAPGVRRIVANNPGPYTFKGTNTYLVGTDELAVIDPGPELEAHRQAILAAAGRAPITHILLTHTHLDHCEGLAALKTATGAETSGFGGVQIGLSDERARAVRRSFVDAGFTPDRRLGGGDTVSGKGWKLTALHTPGHAPDHLCFALDRDGILFSGDHVMGWNTSVVAPPEGNMADYMATLDRLLARADSLYLSGHGEVIPEPRRVVKAYIVHRKMREQAILDCVRDGKGTIASIVRQVYRGIDDSLSDAAGLSVLAHLEHLIERGLVSCEGSPSLRSSFSALR